MAIKRDTHPTEIIATAATTSEQLLESNTRLRYLRDDDELARFGKKPQLKV